MQVAKWSVLGKLVAGLMFIASVPLFAQLTPTQLPPGPGLELIQRSCVNCHDISIMTLKRYTADDWVRILGLMADRGAEVTPDEMQVIEEYVTRNLSEGATRSTSAH
jgi:hypothetical protein